MKSEVKTVSVREAIPAICALRGYSMRGLSLELGSATGVYTANASKVPNIGVGTCNKLLDPLGYEVAFVPKGTRLPGGSFIITNKLD